MGGVMSIESVAAKFLLSRGWENRKDENQVWVWRKDGFQAMIQVCLTKELGVEDYDAA